MKLQHDELNSNVRLIKLTGKLDVPAKMAASCGGRLVLFNPRPTVLNVLDLTGILKLIRICTDLESAKAGMSAG